ncbi:hypothetical protein Dsin_009338 [Dipteronia sinensis]|uniref:RNase H type-1 domain-containing protein n=1 Tax=Dipteronia sinensis TaxID=43782 RepID=A0AAE0AQE6_9ROSI|nr:hypothetical protein Dsin_009338 [Dipteronia sinensis]
MGIERTGGLQPLSVRSKVKDTLAWTHNSDRKFTVGSFRACLKSTTNDGSVDYKNIWLGICPPKLKFSIGLCPMVRFKRGRNTLFFALICSIWEAKNQRIFQGIQATVVQVADLVKSRTAWWFKFHANCSKLPILTVLLNIQESCVDSKPVKSPKGEAWSPPVSSSFKFNVDESLRDCVGVADSVSVELLAIHKAVSLCSNSLFFPDQDVVFISDSKAAVSWINMEGIGNLNHVHLIFDIRNALNNLWNARVVFNPRSSNSFVDTLAKKSFGQEGDKLIWDFF